MSTAGDLRLLARAHRAQDRDGVYSARGGVVGVEVGEVLRQDAGCLERHFGFAGLGRVGLGVVKGSSGCESASVDLSRLDALIGRVGT